MAKKHSIGWILGFAALAALLAVMAGGAIEGGETKPAECSATKAAECSATKAAECSATKAAECSDTKAAECSDTKAAVEKGWIPLFNGKDLEGWKATGKASWTVENKCLVGKQGKNYAPGDLFTVKDYADFELIVEFKMQWPANSGVWFRYQALDKAYQADILEYKDPECYAGTLYCPGKMFLSMNEDPKLVKREGWNTLKIRAEGDHLVITLNGKVTGDVHEASFATGKIGFQIHPGDQFKDMKITVRKILTKPLGK